MAATYPDYRYTMGFAVNGTPIPDPMEFSGAESALDTLGNRDATGFAHRNMVATKHPLKIKYSNIPWSLIKTILGMLTSDKFQFSYPSPATGGISTITAYVGDREWDVKWAPENQIWLGNVNFSVIEY